MESLGKLLNNLLWGPEKIPEGFSEGMPRQFSKETN